MILGTTEWTVVLPMTASVLSFLFVAVYALTHPWRASPMGRHVVAGSIAVGVLGVLVAAATHDRLDGTLDIADNLVLWGQACWLLLCLTMIYRLCLVVKALMAAKER